MAQTTYQHAGAMQRHYGHMYGGGLFAAVADYLARRKTQRELARLDDRMLADIGLSRGDIEIAAVRAAETRSVNGVGSVAPHAGTPFLAQLVRAFAAARVRARMIRELKSMPDHLLRDIGVERWQIGDAVDGILAKKSVAATRQYAAKTSVADVSPVHGLLGRIESALLPLRRWQVTRIAAGQMARFDRDTLADLGYVKGDVDWVPEAMADRQTKRPANLNSSRAGVA